MTEENKDIVLPNGWAMTTIGQLAQFVNGKAFNLNDWKTKGVPIIRIQNLNNKSATFNYIDETNYVEERFKVEQNDLLFAWSGTPGTSFGAHIWSGPRAYLNQHIFKVIPFSGIDKNFLFFTLNYLVNDFIAKSQGTAGLAHITKKELESTACVLPPTEEQMRIVEKIGELFSELTQAEHTLRRTFKQLDIYKHVVLKNAFEGKLLLNKDGDLLNQNKQDIIAHIILAKEEHFSEKIAEWKSLTAKWENDGQIYKTPHRPKPYKVVSPLTKEEIKALPTLPNNWAWIKLNEITSGVSYGSSSKSSKSGKVPVLRMGNIQEFAFNLDDLVYTNNEAEIEKYLLKPGDILFNRTNSPELVGKTAIFKSDKKSIFAGYLIRINHLPEIAIGEYINYYLNSPIAKAFGTKVKTDAVNQSNINGDKLVNYPFPICSISEQQQLVQEIEYHFTIIENLKKTINHSLQKAQIFKDAILKKAFEGTLVSQNPNNSSALLLISKIDEEKKKQLLTNKSDMMNARKNKKVAIKQSIIQVLKSAEGPISAKEVWQQSEHKDDIEAFYSELREIQDKIIEIKKDTESLLSLRHEN